MIGRAKVKHFNNIRMIQLGKNFCFTLETLECGSVRNIILIHGFKKYFLAQVNMMSDIDASTFVCFDAGDNFKFIEKDFFCYIIHYYF